MADRERDNETGQFNTEYSDDVFIDAIEAVGGQASTREVAEYAECDRDTARRRLSKLAEERRVNRREFGRSIAWSIANR